MRRPLLVLLLLTACSSHAPAPGPADPPAARVVYRVVDTSGAVPVTSTSTVDLAAPYRGRALSSDAGRSLGGFGWDENGVYTVRPDGSVQQIEYVPPGFPGPASHLDLALPVAARQRLVRAAGAAQVLGRPCTRWLSAQPLDGARFAPPSAADRTESCVDAAGRLLTDRWFVGGRLVRTRTAVSVGTGPRLAGGGLFDGGEPTPLPTGGSGFVIRRSTTAELSRLLGVAAPAGPAGMRADLATAVLTRGASGFAREGAVLTWTDGTHLAVLRLERDLERAAAPALRGEQVALGHLGSGRLEPVLAGLRVTAAGPRGLRLTATADLPEAALLGWLRSVQL